MAGRPNKTKEERYAKQKEWRINNRERVNNLARLRVRIRSEQDKVRAEEYNKTSERISAKKNTNLKKNYGITLDDYNRMFQEQNGCCKICGKHQQDLKASLHVDHNHMTGKVRGLLCHHCNVGIGHFEDNIVLLSNAITYLGEV